MSVNAWQAPNTWEGGATITLITTEALSSFLDSSTSRVGTDVNLTVTEVLISFSDKSTIRLPVQWIDKVAVLTNWIDKG